MYNGNSINAPAVIGSPFCGNSLPTQVQTSTRFLTVVFTSGASSANGQFGFNMTFVQQDNACGGLIRLNGTHQEGMI